MGFLIKKKFVQNKIPCAFFYRPGWLSTYLSFFLVCIFCIYICTIILHVKKSDKRLTRNDINGCNFSLYFACVLGLGRKLTFNEWKIKRFLLLFLFLLCFFRTFCFSHSIKIPKYS